MSAPGFWRHHDTACQDYEAALYMMARMRWAGNLLRSNAQAEIVNNEKQRQCNLVLSEQRKVQPRKLSCRMYCT